MRNAEVKYKEKEDLLRIEIYPKLNFWLRYGTIFGYLLPFFILISLSIYILFYKTFSFFNNYETYIPIIGSVLFFILLSRIFIKKLFEKEILEINKGEVILKRSLIFETIRLTLKKEDVLDVRYTEKEKITDNILDRGIKNDYLGEKLSEKEIDFFIEDGMIGIYHRFGIVKFGKDIYQVERDEMIRKIKEKINYIE